MYLKTKQIIVNIFLTVVAPLIVYGRSIAHYTILPATGTALPENATYRDITWSSSAPEVAEVDSNGIVTAKAAGKAIISAKTADDVESIVTVKVVSKYHDMVAGGVAIIIVTYGIFISLRRVKHRTTK